MSGDVIERMAFRLQSIIGDHVKFAIHKEAAEAAALVLVEDMLGPSMHTEPPVDDPIMVNIAWYARSIGLRPHIHGRSRAEARTSKAR